MEFEILFRGKRFDDNSWVYGWYCKHPLSGWPLNHCIISKEHAEDGYIKYDKIVYETLCRYTGLTDDKGTKIFEWDILYCEKLDIYFVVKYGLCGGNQDGFIQVEYVGFYLEHIGKGNMELRDDISYWVEYQSAYVKGNIFDNLEILGNAK